ncbi:hypothetical protein AXE80_10730 [Wenyingzhuangia fucanilytica]|uniref:Uncharacterized protein n=1 Tax=Wenyingzhuangia fucanilytica TaxID=1790137 RepID=A0A1B1Y7K4_9FLAO|nr:hypothetical protein [Wenyingzhuangia fucanilytica]ANW96718.1 hypothetical protein AXE80_10730 [Wenyingzhuangia fucanilytica]
MNTEHSVNTGNVMLMSVSDCKHAKNKQGNIGFVTKYQYKINEGDTIIANSKEGTAVYKILKIESVKPATIKGFEYYKALAKRN